MEFFGVAIIWGGAFLFGLVVGFIARGFADNGEREMLHGRMDALFKELTAAKRKIELLEAVAANKRVYRKEA